MSLRWDQFNLSKDLLHTNRLKKATPSTHPLMIGLRHSDILRLRVSDMRKDRIHVQPHKIKYSTGKRLNIEWDDSEELRALVDEILRIPPRRIRDHPLFTTRNGEAYIDAKGFCNTFDSLWQRFTNKVMTKTKVTDRFWERDLRAKFAGDSDTLIAASEHLAHADTAITQRVYRRKPVRVKPLLRKRKTSIQNHMKDIAQAGGRAAFSRCISVIGMETTTARSSTHEPTNINDLFRIERAVTIHC